MKTIIKITLITALFLPCSFSLNAQVDTKGTDFWLAFGQNRQYSATGSDPVSLQIRIVGSEQAATGVIHFTSNNTNVNFTVGAGEVYAYELNNTQKQNAYITGSGYSKLSIHITTSAPVSVYALNQAYVSTDATNILPVTALGTEYYHMSYMPASGMNAIRDAFAVIATENNTRIRRDGTLLSQTFNRGDVYYYTVGNNTTDLTGMPVTADKPVAFFAMNQSVYIPAGVTAMDNLFQQLAPVNTWGKNFFIPVSRQTRNIVRIIASQDGTNITNYGGTIQKASGGQSALTNLKAGQWVELSIELSEKGCYLQADKPVGVCTYLAGGSFTPGNGGDPAQAWMPAMEQSVNSGLIAPFIPSSSSSSALKSHYAIIVTPTAAKDNTVVSIGGAPPAALSGGEWRDHDIAGMSFYDMPLTKDKDSYIYTNTKGGLIIMGYGLGTAESYYYLASSGMRDLTTITTHIITNKHTTVKISK